jgi:hypothetical protein
MEQTKQLSLRIGAVVMFYDPEPGNPETQMQAIATIAGNYSSVAVRAMAEALQAAAAGIEAQEKKAAEAARLIKPS